MFPRPIATREEGKIFRIATCPAGRTLAVVMDTLDGEIRLRDALSLNPRGTLMLGATRTARACAVAADGRTFIVATPDGVECFELGTGLARWSVAAMGDEPAVAISPDGLNVAVGTSPAGLTVHAIADGAEVSRSVTGGGEPRALLWDSRGMVSVDARAVELLGADGRVTSRRAFANDLDEAFEVVAMDADTFAVAGASAMAVWLEICERATGTIRRVLRIDGDRRAEGLAYAGKVLFLATDGGTYRVDPPYEQPVRWLPPMGGTHDPTRLAPARDGHIVVAARDLRVYRCRS